MLPLHFLKRSFPKTPDWLLGGLLLVSLLWLVVLPIEFTNIVIKQEYYYPANDLGWIARFLYIKGYVISMSVIPYLRRAVEADQLLGIVIVLLGLLISSPGYFVTGAL